ncbi:MAG: ATP-dependent DNA helicase RecG [Chloroflexi bacterium RBG_19FT_COMBO_62_14]|nr:MAG: ATP-dependent DNA helicase RecG [Chloroflexi bacterium RBG_19FT_COMBO_62_14]
MNPALDKLTKYLRLEADRGYDNRAVVGGLDRILEPWEAEARASSLPEGLIQVVVSRLRDYAQLSPRSRQEALEGLWARLRGEFPDAWPPSSLGARPPQSAPGGGPPASSVASHPAPDAGRPVPPSPASDTNGEERQIAPVLPATAEEPETASALRSRQPDRTGLTDLEEEPIDNNLVSLPAEDFEEEGTGDEARPPGFEEGGEEGPGLGPSAQGEGRARRRPPNEPIDLASPLTAVSGIGPKSAKTLEKLGLKTLGDLLWYVPRRYDDYSRLKTINRLWYGEEITVMGTVEDVRLRPIRGGRKLVEAVVGDGTGSLRVTWFNQPWIADRLRPDKTVVLSGKVDQYLGRLTMNNPEWEPVERQQLHTNRIVPVYPLTAGVTEKWLRRVINSVVTRLAPRVVDPVPESVRGSANLIGLGKALYQIHFPDDWEALQQAQQRLAFDEMFLLQLSVLKQKLEWQQLVSEPLRVGPEWIERFRTSLPFKLTPAQDRALDDALTDLAKTQPMNRLLQGDVGSGKTIIAAAAIGVAAANGAQSAMMAPTSILAEQHYQTFSELLPRAADIQASSIRLLIGATSEPEKEEIRSGLRAGSIRVVVGTHALLENPIEFRRLRLAVIDEQQRFGVEQRAALRAKGDNPNLMVMSATPIPRSLALTVYGDLDLSVIDEMPPNRQPVETRVLYQNERLRAYQFIRGQLEQGRQAFVIYPLVEGSDDTEPWAVVEGQPRLQEEFSPDYRVGLLHGRMRPEEKSAVMAAFRRGEYHVLASTSVAEVGVDVPNATVMLIEGANRFGLSQLHQFRGRVRRSEHKPYCLLIPDSDTEADNERLKAMESTDDGFRLAELDLEQRGPGDFLGRRQSGFAELKMAKLTDVRLIDKARREAMRLFEADPRLEASEHTQLAGAVARFTSAGKGEIS